MCTVSSKLKLCSCKTTHAETLKHYWVLKRPDGGNQTIVGQAILPANIGKQAHKINTELLGRMLNEGNCFDVDMQHQPGDILELHFSYDAGQETGEYSPIHGDYLAYAFTFSNSKWKPVEFDPFGQNLQDIQQGKIVKPFANR
jgi:hypothetical protein